MRKEGIFENTGPRPPRWVQPQPANNILGLNVPRKAVIGAIMVIALFAFEIFNFDTTRYALRNLLGGVSFAGLSWATILAIAFCAIDFAGLARLFTPEEGGEEPKAVWYLMGAWLLGATMNAVMTWWAVSLTLLTHDFGNEVLSRQQLLQGVPIFVATLVWLTRILFIGSFAVAGEHIFDLGANDAEQPLRRPAQRPAQPGIVERRPVAAATPQRPMREKEPAATEGQLHRRTQRQPPMPGRMQRTPAGVQARRRR